MRCLISLLIICVQRIKEIDMIHELLNKLAYFPIAIDNRLLRKRIRRNIPKLVEEVRKKDRIKVLFVLSSLSKCSKRKR